MRGAPPIAWGLLLLWAGWLLSLQGLLVAATTLGPWAPDLALVLLVALGSRIPRSRALLAAVLLTVARVGHAADSPIAIFTGYAAAVSLTGALARFIDLTGPISRAILAFALTFGVVSFWAAAAQAAQGQGASFSWSPLALQHALATAGAAFLCAPLLLRLPGLRPLWRSAT